MDGQEDEVVPYEVEEGQVERDCDSGTLSAPRVVVNSDFPAPSTHKTTTSIQEGQQSHGLVPA